METRACLDILQHWLLKLSMRRNRLFPETFGNKLGSKYNFEDFAALAGQIKHAVQSPYSGNIWKQVWKQGSVWIFYSNGCSNRACDVIAFFRKHLETSSEASAVLKILQHWLVKLSTPCNRAIPETCGNKYGNKGLLGDFTALAVQIEHAT